MKKNEKKKSRVEKENVPGMEHSENPQGRLLCFTTHYVECGQQSGVMHSPPHALHIVFGDTSIPCSKRHGQPLKLVPAIS